MSEPTDQQYDEGSFNDIAESMQKWQDKKVPADDVTVTTEEVDATDEVNTTDEVDTSLDAFLGEETPQSTNDDVDFDEEYPEIPDDIKGNAKQEAAWGKLRKEAKSFKNSARQYERSVNELKAKLAEAESKISSGGAADEWKSKYEAIRDKDARLALEESPEFINNVLEPLQQVNESLDNLVATYSLSNDDLLKAITAKTPSERNKILHQMAQDAEMNEFDRNDFAEITRQFVVLEAKRQEGYRQANELYSASVSKRESEQTAAEMERRAQIQAKREEVSKMLGDMPILKEFVPNVSSSKLDDFLNGKVDPKLQVYHGYAGLVLPAMKKEIESLRAALKAKVDSSPKAGGGASSRSSAADDYDDSDEAPGAAIFAAMQKRAAANR